MKSSLLAKALAIWASLNGALAFGATPVLVKDLNPGGDAFAESYGQPHSAAVVGGKVIFAASDGTSPPTVWSSDGTSAGTTILKPASAGVAVPRFWGPPMGNLPHFQVMGGLAYFVAEVVTDEVAGGFALWKSDGTAAGTAIVKTGFSYVDQGRVLVAVGSQLFFLFNATVTNEELWKSDGTTAGTVMVKEINPSGSAGSFPAELTAVGATLFFTAEDGTNGRELWKSDGTPAGTVMVKHINAGSASAFAPYSYYPSLTEAGGLLYFAANDGTSGWELWKSDGTSAGTVMVKDIIAGPGSGLEGPSPLPGETQLFASASGLVYFTATDGVNGYELWKSDGTAAGTVMAKDIAAGADSGTPRNLMNMGGSLYLSAVDSSFDRELWKSDGTAAGTTRVKDANAGTNSSYPYPIALVNGQVLFGADDGTHGTELWMTDGTAAGTSLVADLNPGSHSSSPVLVAVAGSKFYFAAATATTGRELYVLYLSPEIVVEQPAGFPLADGLGSVGMAVPWNQVKTFAIRNTGTGSLTGLTLSLHGTEAGNFTLGTLGTTTLAPGGSTTFTVTAVTPQTLPVGYRVATLRIASNDADENPFDVTLTLSSIVRMNWRAKWFGNINQYGDGADNNDPDRDGVNNVLEFATGSNPTAATPAPGTLARISHKPERQTVLWTGTTRKSRPVGALCAA